MSNDLPNVESIQCGHEWNPTLRENIDFKIAKLLKEVARLESSKIDMAPLMDIHIQDIRSAMLY